MPNMVGDRAEQYVPLPDSRATTWSQYGQWNEEYFPKLVGLVVEEVRVDYCRMRLPFRSQLNQPAGVVHGGAIATLVDSVVVPAIGSGYEERRNFVTITMNIQYRAAVVGEDMIAEGWVTQRGNSIVFCDAEVRTASGKVVATGQLVYKVSSRTVG